MKKISQNKLYLYFSILVIIVAILAIILGTVFGIKSKNAELLLMLKLLFTLKLGKKLLKENLN